MALKYQEDGKFSGDCFMRVMDRNDYNDIKRLNLGRMGHRYIEILDSNEAEYIQAKNSQKYKMSENIEESLHVENNLEENGVLRLRGLPYQAGEFEVEEFF
jgi:hypothetical protein